MVKRIYFWMGLVFCLVVFYGARGEVNPYFTPSRDCENNAVQLLLSADKTIDIAIYALNSEKITNTILAIHDDERIKVRILADKLQAGQKNSRVRDIYRNGVNIRVNSFPRIQHNKYIVVDGHTLMTGSFNFTESASDKNSENCLFVTDQPRVTEAYQKNFNNLWEKNPKIKSDQWFIKKGL